jgi:hypothetical protein
MSWFEHFETKNGYILPLTDIGTATVNLLELNKPNKVEERFEMLLSGFYP